MTLLLDTSLWIDFTRTRSPLPLKHLIAPFVLEDCPCRSQFFAVQCRYDDDVEIKPPDWPSVSKMTGELLAIEFMGH